LPLTVQCGRFRWSATWFMTVLTALAVTAFISLGRWQWHRADEKRALLTQFSAGAQAPIDLEHSSTDPLPRYSRIRVFGQYDSAHQFLLDNMSHDGAPGYEVLTPLLLADGHAMLVNRGWVPLTRSRRELPDIRLPGAAGAAIRVSGQIDNLPVAALSMGHAAPAGGPSWPKLTSFPTTADLSAALGRPLESRQLLLAANQPYGYLRDWQPVGFGPMRHVSYAIQWWLFAALALGLFAWLNRRAALRAEPLRARPLQAGPSQAGPVAPMLAGAAATAAATPGAGAGDRRVRQWPMLLALGAMFIGPPLLATLLYYGTSWRPAGHTNHGQLIQPPRPLAASVFQGKWSLVYLGAGDCDAGCRTALYTMRQTHWGLGELAPQLQRLFLATARCCDRAHLDTYPGLITLDETGPSGAMLLRRFPADARSTSLFVVDPRGDLMMRYDLRAPPKGLLQDLKRLLQATSIG
jgi:surfeit locus 1 family protein